MEREEKEREREQEEAYCKTVLYLYPYLSRMAEATKKSVYTQAVLSYRYAGGGKWFEENFSSMDWAMTVYKKVLAGKDACLLGKRKKGLDAAKGNVRSAT